MLPRPYLNNAFIGAVAVLFAGGRFVPSPAAVVPLASAAAITSAAPTASAPRTATTSHASASGAVAAEVKEAIDALASAVRPLSRPEALEDAFRGYFEFKAAHPDEVKKPYLYFVDYGLPSTTTRGYVFDMSSLTIVDGPFTVAHGRGSSTSQYGVPTRFSNASGSNATSLGLYVTGSTYEFHGHSAGHPYTSIGLQLNGESQGFNDRARARGVVAHGAPYVTPSRAGRSEGCPAMEPARAQRLLPELANGAVVFLFAPNEKWLAGDERVTGSAAGLGQ